MKLVPVIAVVGVTVAVIAAWKMGLFPEKAKDAVEQGRAVAEKQISKVTTGTKCDPKDLENCTNQAYRMYQGFDGEADKAKATKLTRSACDRGYLLACTNLGYFIAMDGDLKAAFALMDKACDQGDGSECSWGAGLLTSSGLKQYQPAMAYLLKGCAKGYDNACKEAYTQYTERSYWVGVMDPAKGTELAKQVCAKNSESSLCYYLKQQ